MIKITGSYSINGSDSVKVHNNIIKVCKYYGFSFPYFGSELMRETQTESERKKDGERVCTCERQRERERYRER